MKKKAVFLATNERFVFAVGTLLLSLKKTSPKTVENCDILIYVQDVSDKSKEILNKILPCKFTEYKFAVDTDFDDINFKNFSQLTFARYEIFDLLNTYEKVLYMDADIMIGKELYPVFDYGESGLAMAKDVQKGLNLITKNFVEPVPGYDMTVPNFNAGVTLFTNKLPKINELKMYCYHKTAAMLKNLVCPDQGVINLMMQDYNIKTETMNPMFNCLVSLPQYFDKKHNDVYVYHCAGGGLRFWGYTYFKMWEEYYQQWLSLGGQAHREPQSGWYKFVKKHGLYKYSFFDRCPNPVMHPARFLKYVFLKGW
ncbi:MAG: hypothetical protein FWF35_01290 [Elusimicrobia bacterium]|nr:hypothetical protein [Elusimicrobiota bacterium]